MSVFVLDKRKQPLMPCSEKRARQLLEKGRAVVVRLCPFTIRLKDRLASTSSFQPLLLKLDPGSRVTGMAVVRVQGRTHHVLHLAELQHRGQHIRKKLHQRRLFRRRRRSVNLRYRAPRFANRRRPPGWLPPSLAHRVHTTLSWVNKYRRWLPLTRLEMELARFDTQKLQNPELQGVEYQRGELWGVEVREYLLFKWGHRCAYCDRQDGPLQVEHIVARSRGGSNRVSNLTLACVACNQSKANRDVREFLAHAPNRLNRILAQTRRPLRDAAALNSTRRTLYRSLRETGLAVQVSSGARTKYNREQRNIPKSHALDAACVGSIEQAQGWEMPVLGIKCRGRGSYQRTRLTKHGFPRGYLTRSKRHFGFGTGDLVRAEVAKGKKAGRYRGRVAVRVSGSFNIQTGQGVVQGVSWRYCHLLQRNDGYAYIQEGLEQRRRAGLLPSRSC